MSKCVNCECPTKCKSCCCKKVCKCVEYTGSDCNELINSCPCLGFCISCGDLCKCKFTDDCNCLHCVTDLWSDFSRCKCGGLKWYLENICPICKRYYFEKALCVDDPYNGLDYGSDYY